MKSIRVLCVGAASGLADGLDRAHDGLEVTLERAGADALDRVEAWRPDCLVVSDIHEFDALEFFDAVRDRDGRVPFIMLDETDTAAADALDAGVTDYVRTGDPESDVAVLVNRIETFVGDEGRRRTLDRYETVVEALGDPVYALDDDGRFTYVNQAFLDFVSYDEETVLGSLPDLVKGPEAVETAEKQLGRLLSSDGPDSATFELQISPKDGDPIICEDHMGVMWEADGRFRGSAGSLRDVSDRVERERRIREERKLLERSLNTLDDIYYLLDPSGAIERSNDSLAAVTGYDDPEGMDALNFFEEDDSERVAAAIADVVESGSARVEADVVTRAGEHIPYEFTGTRLTDEDGDLRGVIGVGRDVTERVAFESELEHQNDRLEEFVNVVSHDLRNPLNVAQGRIQLLRETDDEEHIDAVARSLDRMDVLIDDLLTLAREGESLDSEPVGLRALAEASRNIVEAGDGTLHVRTDAVVLADESRLKQLIENLIRNALDHGGSSVTVTVGDLEDGSGFYVSDDGPGIPEAERDQVFEDGYSSTREGTGFGLSIVETVASAHGWDVTLTARNGDGAAATDGSVDREHDPAHGARFEFRGVEFAE